MITGRPGVYAAGSLLAEACMVTLPVCERTQSV
jgi:hypothetical protein